MLSPRPRRRWAALRPVHVALVVVAALSSCGAAEVADPPGPRATHDTSGPAEPGDATVEDPERIPAQSSAPLLSSACAGGMAVTSPGSAPAGLSSISGLVASRRHPGVVWAVEDSFEPAELTGISTADATVVARVRVNGGLIANVDWEDLATSDGSDGPMIHIADTGDNLGIRAQVRVLSFPEPDLGDTTVRATVQRLSYQDGRPNAEAMVVHDDEIWILDKQPDGPSGLYRSALSGDGAAQSSTLVRVSEIDLGGQVATAADLSPDGSVLAVRTNTELRLHPVEPGDDIRAALGNEPCTTPDLDEAQGESVAVLPGVAGLVTVSEDESGGTVAMHLTAPG